MATKKEIFESALKIMEEHGAPADLVEDMSKLLAPGKGGQRVNIDEITRKDDEGNITHIKCRYSGAWLPATTEYFPKDTNSKIVGTDEEALYTVSKAALKIRQEAQKAYKASKEAITNDLLDGNIDREEAKEALANLSAEPDYSSIEDVE